MSLTPSNIWLPIYTLSGDQAMDLLYETFDSLLFAERFDEVDQALRAVDPGRLSVELWVELLTITFVAKEHLPSRPELFVDIRNRLDFARPGRADSILRGLE